MRTLVVGGGIGGLATAIALDRIGHQVSVVEKLPDFTPVGAGIVMAPNAAKMLAELGVDLSRYAFALASFDVVDTRGRLLQRLDTQRMSRQYGPMWALSRPQLHTALLDAVPERVRLLRACDVHGIQQTGQGVEVRIEPESHGRTVDVVVGADGLHSTVRRLTLGPQPLRYSGVTCWRGLTDNPGFDRALESWGTGTRIGVVPLPDNRLYYYLVRSAPRRAAELDWPTGFRRVFGEHRGEPARLFDVLTQMPPLHHDLEELAAPVWGSGRVLLLGDAAHAMTPNQGQGAAMAIEDAYALMTALRPGVDGALRRYVQARHQRVRSMQLSSRRIGEVSHWINPVARTVRDGVMRLLPQAASDAQYRRLVQPALDLMAAA